IVVFMLYLVRHQREGGTLPARTLRDPYLLACLRGGTKEVVRVATLALIDGGMIEVAGSLAQTRSAGIPAAARSKVERAVLTHFRRGAALESVLDARAALDSASTDYADVLERRGLLPDREVRRFRILSSVIAVLVLAAVAGVKIMVAIGRGRSNVGLLLM